MPCNLIIIIPTNSTSHPNHCSIVSDNYQYNFFLLSCSPLHSTLQPDRMRFVVPRLDQNLLATKYLELADFYEPDNNKFASEI
jgi:hypothetical protein